MHPTITRWCAAGALLAALLLPTAAHAAPPAQEDDLPGVYASEPLENELTDDILAITMTLFEDGSAEYATHYANSGTTSYQVGIWELDDEGALLVLLETRLEARSGRGSPNEPPTEIPFTIDGDSLIAPDYLMYGPRDLTLTRTDAEPATFLDGNRLRADLITGLDDYPNDLYAGRYTTPEFTFESLTLWFELTLAEDGTLRLDYPDGELNDGAWSEGIWENLGDGTILLSIVTDYDAGDEAIERYDPPTEFGTLERLETGGLVLRDPLPDGSQVIFSRADEAPAVAGLYGAGVLTGAGPVVTLILYLAEDGVAHTIFGAITGEAPLAQLRGIWDVSGSTVTLTGTQELVLEEGELIVRPTRESDATQFTWEEGRLVSDELTLYSIPMTDETGALLGGAAPETPAPRPTPLPPAPAPRADATYMVAREQLVAGNTLVLSLNGDGTAALSTQLGADAATRVELGAWEEEEETLVVTLTRDIYGDDYAEPYVLLFERTDERTLTAIDYDAERYGEDLVLYSTIDY